MKYNEEEKKSNIGKIITFGSLNLTFNLALERNDINSNIFEKLENLEDLTFLSENKKLWEKIELTTKNELLNSIIIMNKIKKKKNIVSYLVYNKIELIDELAKFKNLIDTVLLDNGLVVIGRYDICQCQISINLILKYKDKKKSFNIIGENNDNDNDNEGNKDENENEKKEGSKKEEGYKESTNSNEEINQKGNDEDESQKKEEEEDPNDIGDFEKIPEDEVKFSNFKYLYIQFQDYFSKGEFSNSFKPNQLYNYLNKLKKSNKIKIIINLGENIDQKNFEYIIKFMKISDIHIFRNKKLLLKALNERKKAENEKREKEIERLQNILRTQRLKKSKELKRDKNLSMNDLNFSETSRSIRRTVNKSQSFRDLPLLQTFSSLSNSKGNLDKNNAFLYLKEKIYISNINENHPNFNDKLGIYLDGYKSINLVDYKKMSFVPSINEYELNIIPKYVIKEIELIKDILEKNDKKYTNLLYGCILSTIVDDINEDSNNYIMFYFNCNSSLIKILNLDKYKIPPPKDKSFYIVQIDKGQYDKVLKTEIEKKQENGFNNNYYHKSYKGNETQYFPLMDKYLTSYMQSSVNIDVLQNKNMINKKKRILYDSEYKDFFKNGYKYTEELNKKKLSKFILEQNISDKEKDFKKEFLNKKPELRYHIPGINGIPEYIVYLNKEERKNYLKNRFPPIKKKAKEEKKEFSLIMKKPLRVDKNKENLKEAENKPMLGNEERVKTNELKEIKFNLTPLEKDNH